MTILGSFVHVFFIFGKTPYSRHWTHPWACRFKSTTCLKNDYSKVKRDSLVHQCSLEDPFGFEQENSQTKLSLLGSKLMHWMQILGELHQQKLSGKALWQCKAWEGSVQAVLHRLKVAVSLNVVAHHVQPWLFVFVQICSLERTWHLRSQQVKHSKTIDACVVISWPLTL